jgi:predicted helicase
VKVHKESGIRNDPTGWSAERNNPRYILDLLLSVMGISVETVGITANLPKMELK